MLYMVKGGAVRLNPHKDLGGSPMYKFKSISKQPLAGLALAIAGGFVLAHQLNELADYLWLNYISDFLGKNSQSLIAWIIILAMVLSACVGLKRMRAKVDLPRLSPRRFKSRGHWLFGMFSVACVVIFGMDVIIHGALMLFTR